MKLTEAFANCDAYGPLEWFDRLAAAIHEQDKAVLSGDRMAVQTWQNIAASSAMRLVREHENAVRAALQHSTSSPGQS